MACRSLTAFGTRVRREGLVGITYSGGVAYSDGVPGVVRGCGERCAHMGCGSLTAFGTRVRREGLVGTTYSGERPAAAPEYVGRA